MKPFAPRSFALACTFALAAAAHAAPDEAGFGANEGFPVGTRANWLQKRFVVGSFSTMEKIFPVRELRAAATLRPLPAADKPLDWARIDQCLAAHPATGLLIIKDGRVLAERYQYGRNAEHRFTSFSMVKTLVGMAVGAALADGAIARSTMRSTSTSPNFRPSPGRACLSATCSTWPRA